VRRICLVCAALVGSLVLGVTVAAAAKPKPKVKTTKVSCKASLTVAIPAGDTDLALPADSGDMLGPVSCGKAGRGLGDYSFALQDTGDLTGSFKTYFADGTVHGTFDLTPADSAPSSPGTFSQQSYTGTGKLTGGTGADKGLSGTMTLSCSTLDSVHFSCKEQLKLKA
jgi:hypothetical protein